MCLIVPVWCGNVAVMQNRSEQQSITERVSAAITAAGHTHESIGAATGIAPADIRTGHLDAGEVATIATATGHPYLALLGATR